MVIKKIPVISWLLFDKEKEYKDKLLICESDIPANNKYLYASSIVLSNIRDSRKHDWGLPEYVMPSFDKAMQKSEVAFQKIWAELFKEYSEKQVCGIIISPLWGSTIIYGFGNNTVNIWLYRNLPEGSFLSLYCEASINSDNLIESHAPYSIVHDPNLFLPKSENNSNICETLCRYVVDYVSLKKYAPVETIIVANNTVVKIDDGLKAYKQKEKIKNDTGQKVVVMDSKWFTKIVNDNDIFVRGFFRLQNKKNAAGEWYKELIYVDSFVRHGYHRNAKIEDSEDLLE